MNKKVISILALLIITMQLLSPKENSIESECGKSSSFHIRKTEELIPVELVKSGEILSVDIFFVSSMLSMKGLQILVEYIEKNMVVSRIFRSFIEG